MTVASAKPNEKSWLMIDKPAKQTHNVTMKRIWNLLNYCAFIALSLCAVSCTNLKNQENLAVAAGFKIINPTTPDQQALLAKLPKDQVTRINYNGKTYFVLPDVKNNVAYVGRDSEYRAYQNLRLQQELTNDNLEAASLNEEASMNWGAWGGWYAVP